MTTIEDFWRATRQMVEDPDWRVYKYYDDALQFVCEECHTSIWQGRTVVSCELGNYKIQAQYAPKYEKVFCSASEDFDKPPRHADILPVDKWFTELPEEKLEKALWYALVGWSESNQGPPVHEELPFKPEKPNWPIKLSKDSTEDVEHINGHLRSGMKELLQL